MAEFGPNGTVMSPPSRPAPPEADYAVPVVAKFKRIGLASFLCGMAACILVTLIGAGLLFLAFQISALFGQDAARLFADDGLMQGAGLATLMAAMNWYLAYFTVPAAWIAIAFSLGRFPRRGIMHAPPYYRWGAIWGAVLVGITAGLGAYFMSSMNSLSAIGAAITGGLIGAVAGLICGAIFRGIVRPAEQVKRIQVEVF